MKELQEAFYEVMYKYEKSFGEDGVTAILTEWEKNKAPLLELLRHHPNWREEEKAVVLEFAEGRGIERDVVDEIVFTMLEMAGDIIPAERQEDFRAAFQAAVVEYSSTVSEDNLTIIRTRGGIKCAQGQKTSRIIGKLCRQFGVDAHKRYNVVFAQLADALNPMQIQKTAVLSLHPCDYLEMSSKSNTWISCHRLNNGGYQAGTLSYLMDGVSMIFFTVDPDVKDHFYRAPRRGRQMFFYRDNMLFQSRQYPQDADDLMKQYRSLAQKIITTSLGVPNLWLLKTNREELDEYYETDEQSQHYPDYEYHGNLSLLKGAAHYGRFYIGHPSLCVCCGRPYNSRNTLKCSVCHDTVVCKECGQTVPRSNASYLDGAFHCYRCLHICADCGTAIINGAMYPAFDRRGNLVEVCEACYQSMQEPCRACSVRNVCHIIGNMLCHRVALRAAER